MRRVPALVVGDPLEQGLAHRVRLGRRKRAVHGLRIELLAAGRLPSLDGRCVGHRSDSNRSGCVPLRRRKRLRVFRTPTAHITDARAARCCDSWSWNGRLCRRIEYYYVNVRDELGAAYRVLSALSQRGVELLAFTAVPSGADRAQFAIFPEDPSRFAVEARLAQIEVDGPHHALLVQGDDELGELARVHERLFRAGVDVYASSGVSDGRGSFGYIVYVREDQFEQAAVALEI